MLKRLPLYERKNKVFQEIFKAEINQLQNLEEQIEDIRKQFVVDTATWGLKIYEKELKITVPFGSSIENRRAAIKAKMRSGGKVDRFLLEAVASAILEIPVKVDFNGRIIFGFKPDTKKTVSNIEYFYRSIEKIKPAHLAFELHAKIQEDIILNEKSYSIDVPFKITNSFHTASLPGLKVAYPTEIQEKAYSFGLVYPITNMFTIESFTGYVKDGMGFNANASSNLVKYPRVGVATATSGNLTPTGNANYSTDMSTISSSNAVKYMRTGNSTARKGTDE